MYTIEYKYATKILDKKTVDDSYFAFISEQDDEKEIADESNWIKSNPILEVPALYEKGC